MPRITIGAAIGLLGGRGPTSLVTAIDAYRLPYGSQPNSFSYLQATIGARHAQRRQDFAIGQALAPSGFAVGYASEAEGQRNVYGRVGGVVALTKRIDVEFGAALSSSETFGAIQLTVNWLCHAAPIWWQVFSGSTNTCLW